MKTYWLIPGFALLLLGAGCALSKSQTNQVAQTTATPSIPLEGGSGVPLAPNSDPSRVASPLLGGQGGSPVPAAELPPIPHVVSVNAGEFFFDPSSINAKAGETLTINFGTVTGHHTFTIDELNISQEMTPGGSVTFTVPSTAGRYTYYCSVGPHRTLGMTGTLIVE